MRYGWVLWLIAMALAVGCGGDDKKSDTDITDVVAADGIDETVEQGETVDGQGETGEDITSSEYPDPTFVHKFTSDPVTGATDKYPMDAPTQYRTTEILPSLDVRAMAQVGGLFWVGTY